MNKPSIFLSCEWGISSFRLWLVEEPHVVLGEEKNNNGINSMYERWKQSGKCDDERLSFYQDFLLAQIGQLERKLALPLRNIPVIISGMASSSMGMLELPYKPLPFSMNGTDLYIHTIGVSPDFPYQTLLVSGVKSDDDVMRGEEVRLVGCWDEGITGEQLYLFPGTHSKHIRVIDGVVTSFQTYMTGELLHLLSTKSILSDNVEAPGDGLTEDFLQCFVEGVNDSDTFNPLRAFFFVRTNHLFKKMTKEENFFYLSGLLIGLEVKELQNRDSLPMILVTTALLKPYYLLALQQLDLSHNLQVKSIDKAIVEGHGRIFQLFKSRQILPESLLKPFENA